LDEDVRLVAGTLAVEDRRMSEWSLEPIFGSGAVWLLAALLGIALAFGPRFGRLTPRRRATITVLRGLVILLVLLAMLRPTHVFTSSRPRNASLLVLFDVSRSMLLPDRTGGPTRWESERQSLNKILEWSSRLGDHLQLEVAAYDAQLHPLERTGGSLSLPEKPEGSQTDLGASLEEALKRQAGKRIAAVIALGDGRHTAYNSPVDAAVVARRLRDEFNSPLYATPFGLTGDAAQAKDVAIERLDEQYTVFVKNEVVVRGRMRIAGFANQPVAVEALLTDVTGKQTVIGSQNKAAGVESDGVEFEFPYVPQQPGHYKVTVKAAVQPGELVVKNNELSAYLTVLEGGLRVLLIDSGKRPEFKFLRRSLAESPDIELDDLIIDATNRKAWPVNLGTTLKDGKYDVFLLGNVPADALGEANMKALADEVAKGKGLLALGGLRTFGAGNYYGTPLADVLPIALDRFEKQDFDAPDRPDLFVQGPLPMTPVASHAVTRLAEGQANAAVWQKLPPLDFANHFAALKPTPGVRVLLSGPRQEPLLVSGEFGSGRTLAFAGESTYRWPLKGFAAEHKRFWRQSILWLARRDESQQSEVWIKLAQRRFAPGANVNFTVGARSPEGDALRDAQFTATLVGPDGKVQPQRLSPAGEQQAGILSVKEPGDYAIELVATRQGQTLGKARAEFLVFDQDVELASAAADHENLARLANITKEFGGRMVAPEELDALLSEIASRPPETEVRQQRWRLGDDPLAAWVWLLAFTGLLGTEWWLRKRWGLV
jgi:hypothetical protein